jgi:hypothetical protein
VRAYHGSIPLLGLQEYNICIPRKNNIPIYTSLPTSLPTSPTSLNDKLLYYYNIILLPFYDREVGREVDRK